MDQRNCKLEFWYEYGLSERFNEPLDVYMKEPFLIHTIETLADYIHKGIVAHRIGTQYNLKTTLFFDNVNEIILPVSNESDSGNYANASSIVLPLLTRQDSLFILYLLTIDNVSIMQRDKIILGDYAQCYLTVVDSTVSIIAIRDREKSFFTFDLSTNQLFERTNTNIPTPLDLTVETRSKMGRIVSDNDYFILELFV